MRIEKNHRRGAKSAEKNYIYPSRCVLCVFAVRNEFEFESVTDFGFKHLRFVWHLVFLIWN